MKTRKGTADLEHVTQAKVGQTVPDVFLRSQLSLMPELKNGFAFVGLKFVSCLRSSGLHLVGQCQAQPDLRTFQQTKESRPESNSDRHKGGVGGSQKNWHE